MTGPSFVPAGSCLSATFSRGAAGFGSMVTRCPSPNSGAGEAEEGGAVSVGVAGAIAAGAGVGTGVVEATAEVDGMLGDCSGAGVAACGT